MSTMSYAVADSATMLRRNLLFDYAFGGALGGGLREHGRGRLLGHDGGHSQPLPDDGDRPHVGPDRARHREQ
jgi:hypothetical protein